MAAVVDAELDHSSHEIESSASKAQSAIVRFTDDDAASAAATKKHLTEMGLDAVTDLVMVTGKSVGCYFMCSSEERLIQLRKHFTTGVMRNALQNVVTFLTGAGQPISICHLKWDSQEYWQTMQRLIGMRTLG